MTDRDHRPAQDAGVDVAARDAGVDAMFGAARSQPLHPLSDDLFARIMADAADVQPRGVARSTPVGGGMRRALVDLLGGWPTLAGLTTATLAGIWIGVAQPAGVVALQGNFGLTPVATQDGAISYGIEDLMPGFDSLVQEG